MGCFGKKKDGDNVVVLEDVDPAPFKFPASQLAALFDPKSTDLLTQMGGGAGICSGLLVDPTTGLDEDAAKVAVDASGAHLAVDASHLNGIGGPQKVSICWDGNGGNRRLRSVTDVSFCLDVRRTT